MNRQEAALVIKDRLNDEIWKQENGLEVFPVNMDAFRVAIKALRGSQPDPKTGLVPCGCGGEAILFHQPDIEGPGSDGDRWAVFCEKMCGMGTSDTTSPERAVEIWNTGMGYKEQ